MFIFDSDPCRILEGPGLCLLFISRHTEGYSYLAYDVFAGYSGSNKSGGGSHSVYAGDYFRMGNISIYTITKSFLLSGAQMGNFERGGRSL